MNEPTDEPTDELTDELQNELQEIGLILYRESQGLISEKMPIIIYDNMFPFSTSDVMQGVLDGIFDLKMIDYYSITTGDTVYYHPDGRFKLVHDDKFLRNVDEEYELLDGGFVIQEELFEEVIGQDYTKYGLPDFNKSMTISEADDHPGLLFLSRNFRLLRQFNEHAFSQTKSTKSMGFYLSPPSKSPIVRPISVHNNCGDVYIKADHHAELSGSFVSVNPLVVEAFNKVGLGQIIEANKTGDINRSTYGDFIEEYFKRAPQFKRFLR